MQTPMAARMACAAGILAVAAGAVWAHGGATGIVAERMNGMMEMARSIKELSQEVEKPSIDPELTRRAAQTVRRHAGGTMVALFSEDSIDPPSDASPLIWEEWQEFSRLAERLRALGGDLAQAADSALTTGKIPTPQAQMPPQRGEKIWASLDERVLLGLEPIAEPSPDPAETPPSVRETLAAITQTCSQCHQKFRAGGT